MSIPLMYNRTWGQAWLIDIWLWGSQEARKNRSSRREEDRGLQYCNLGRDKRRLVSGDKICSLLRNWEISYEKTFVALSTISSSKLMSSVRNSFATWMTKASIPRTPVLAARSAAWFADLSSKTTKEIVSMLSNLSFTSRASFSEPVRVLWRLPLQQKRSKAW